MEPQDNSSIVRIEDIPAAKHGPSYCVGRRHCSPKKWRVFAERPFLLFCHCSLVIIAMFSCVRNSRKNASGTPLFLSSRSVAPSPGGSGCSVLVSVPVSVSARPKNKNTHINREKMCSGG